jgi:hypothetical protein
MWIFTNSSCSHSFDNGWDAAKSFSSLVLVPQIFSSEVDNDYQTSTVDNINNTEIGFYSGEDSIYTLTFTHENLDAAYSELYLIDMQIDSTIDISQSGTEYPFLVRSTDTLIKRFKIVTNIGVATDTKSENKIGLKVFSSEKILIVQNYTNINGKLFLYDISGQLIINEPFNEAGVTTLNLKLPTGVYVAKCVAGGSEVVSRVVIK